MNRKKACRTRFCRLGIAKVQFFGFFRGKFTGIHVNYYSIISLFAETINIPNPTEIFWYEAAGTAS